MKPPESTTSHWQGFLDSWAADSAVEAHEAAEVESDVILNHNLDAEDKNTMVTQKTRCVFVVFFSMSEGNRGRKDEFISKPHEKIFPL